MSYPKSENEVGAYRSIRLFLVYGIITTIAFSLLNLNSILIILLVFTRLMEGPLKSKFRFFFTDKLLMAYTLYVLLQFIGLPREGDLHAAWKEVESKLGFLAIPFVLCSGAAITTETRRKIMMAVSLAFTAAAMYCLLVAAFNFLFRDASSGVFFYHQLVSPLLHHAIYFSVYLFLALVFIIYELRFVDWFRQRRAVTFGWILFLILVLFLLSSKLVLSVLVLFSLVYALQMWHGKKRAPLLVAALLVNLLIAVIFFTDNPVRSRFIDMKGNIQMLSLEKYDAGMYFNPWEFRLLLWRITYEIIDDQDAWLSGVGPANDQKFLQQKYLSMGLYSGEQSRGDTGYLDFNCHNQFLQSFLESGIPGLLVLIFFWCVLVYRTILKKLKTLYWIVFVISCFFFTESVFERQYGMILATVLPLIYLYSTPVDRNKSS